MLPDAPAGGRTIACEPRDFPEWHGGCAEARVWAVEVDLPQVRRAVASLRDRLGGLLLPRYARQPHVTIAYAGLVDLPDTTPSEPVYSDEDLSADLAALAARVAGPFDLTIAGWSSFPMVPYLAVQGDGLGPLHDALTARRPHGTAYVPHVTAGHYAAAGPMSQVAGRLDGWSADAVRVPVEHVSLLSYQTHDFAGPLTTVGRVSLRDGRWLPEPA